MNMRKLWYHPPMSVTGTERHPTNVVYDMGASENVHAAFTKACRRADVQISTKFTPQIAGDTENPVADMPAGSQRGDTYNPLLPQIEKLVAVMRTVGDKYGITPAQVALAWAIAKGTTPIIDVTKVAQVRETAQAAKITLTEEDIRTLETAAECARIVRFYNEKCARLKSDYPDKFLFCASLPLPDVETAIKEAVYALDTLGADGIKLATNSRGQYLGDPALDPLMSVLNQCYAVVILHPHKPVPVNDTLIAAAPIAIYEYPAETTRTVVNMIAHNVPARYPDIRFVIPHCGSFLPLAVPRMKMVHPAMVAKGLMNPIDWEANLKNLYYDLAGGATPDVIKTLLTITTPEHLMYGSDYPYQPAAVLTGNLNKLRSTLESDEMLAPHMDGILFVNAYKLFNLTK